MPSGQNNNRKIRPPKNNKEKIPGAVIAIYVVMIILVLAICGIVFAITLKKTQENNSTTDSSYSESSTSSESSESSEYSDPESSEDPDSESSDSSDSSDSDSSDPDNSGTSSEDVPPGPLPPTVYTEEFFENDLFIGDSIFTGLYLYEFIPMENVAAAVGYTPYKALNGAFSRTYSGSAADYAKELQPVRIYIMLGSNAIGSGADLSIVISQYRELLKALQLNCPDSRICVISIPPVAEVTEYTNLNNSDINSVNAEILKMCSELGADYYDLNAELIDEKGYFRKDLAEADGLHFKGTTYKVLLSGLEALMS